MAMSVQTYTFQTHHAFVQAAFDQVAKIVGSNGDEIITGGNCSPSTETCLFHIEQVCIRWGYDASRITALYELSRDENANLKEMLLQLGDHDD